jgi:hypothetical protein
MRKQFRRLLGRAWLSGMFTWFPAGLLGSIVGIFIFLYAQSNLTPYSVHVSGYYRSNGTYVNPYTRRPPGSVNHDEPYGVVVVFGRWGNGKRNINIQDCESN